MATIAWLRSGNGKTTATERTHGQSNIHPYCYGHALHLACGDTTIKQCKSMKDALDTTHEITKIIKKSPHRDACEPRVESADFAKDPEMKAHLRGAGSQIKSYNCFSMASPWKT